MTVAKIGFWNAGRETIERDDVSPRDPLRIELAEGEILEAVVVATTSPTVALTAAVASDRKSASVDFDYLDWRQGAVIQIAHTGPEGAEVAVRGTLKGAGEPKRRPEVARWLLYPYMAVTMGPALLAAWGVEWIVHGAVTPWLATGIWFGVLAGVMFLLVRLTDRYIFWEYVIRIPAALRRVKLPRLAPPRYQ